MICLDVQVKVKPGTEDGAVENFRLLQAASRKEPGCRMYIVHQRLDDPGSFLIYEQYDDEAALDAHRSSIHFRQYAENGVYRHVIERKAGLFRPI